MFIMVFGAVGHLKANEIAEQLARMKALSAQLQILQQQLVDQQKEMSNQQRALQTVEKTLADIQSSVRKQQQLIASINRDVASNQQNIQQLQEALASKSEQIEEILRVAYKQNNQPLIKLLMSNERPEDYARQLYYFAKVAQQQREQIQQWLSQQEDLRVSEDKLVSNKAQLAQTLLELTQQQNRLEQQKNQRAQAVENIQKQATNTAATIASVEAERVAMAELIAALEAKLAEFSIENIQVGDIRKAKGQLPWPVTGRLQNTYNSLMDDSSLRWQGYLINTDAGEPVRAVHAGQVIFADFFRSNGLLMILDHGNGVMTLYGRNQSLLKDVGTWVNAGDVIAEVGQTGGYNRNGLYFEVRNNGQPENPANWLARR